MCNLQNAEAEGQEHSDDDGIQTRPAVPANAMSGGRHRCVRRQDGLSHSLLPEAQQLKPY